MARRDIWGHCDLDRGFLNEEGTFVENSGVVINEARSRSHKFLVEIILFYQGKVYVASGFRVGVLLF